MTLRLGTPITLVLVFSIWVFLSTFKSGDPALAQSTFFDLFFKSVIIFLLVTQTIRDRNGFRILCSAFTFAALGISLIALYRTFALPESSAERVGSVGLLADPNDAAAIMILIFPFALASLKRRTPAFFFKIICLVTLSTSLLMVYFSKSRGALLSILIMFASMFILKFRNKGRAVLVSILVLALFVPVSSMFHRSESDRTESVDSRIIYWKTGAIMAFRSPIFGVGFNGYPENFEKYAPNIIESGYRTAHSSWILALTETGFLGFLLFSSLFVWAIRTAWKLRPEYPELFFATLGYGVAMSFLSHTYLIYFYLLVALIFVASRFPESTSPP